MANVFLGQIALFGFNFAPVGWAQCNGQVLQISQNTALFSILGTIYGGNGQTNFALPNLNIGCVMGGSGSGPGLTPRALGEVAGSDTITLLSTQIPAHSHTLSLSAGPASPHSVPTTNDALVDPKINVFLPAATAPQTTTLLASTVAGVGGSQPHNNDQPALAMQWCIALQGIYPPRN